MPSFAAPGVPGGVYTSPPAAPKQDPPTAGPSTLPSPPSSSISGTSGGANLAATLEQLRLVAQKRVTTFVYLKRACEGKVHWFNTVLLTRPKLEAALDPASRLTARTTRFAVLGMSLSGILDITTVGDFVKALVNLLQEYEAIPDANFRPKMVRPALLPR